MCSQHVDRETNNDEDPDKAIILAALKATDILARTVSALPN